MTILKFRYTFRLLLGTLAICCTNWSAALHADVVVFQYRTTIDASPIGGPASAPLVVTYAFDSTAQGIGSTRTVSYPTINTMIQVADQTVIAPGPSADILVSTQGGPLSEQLYQIYVPEPRTAVAGTLFGWEVFLFDFGLIAEAGLMFDSPALPVSPAFSEVAQYTRASISLFHPATNDFTYLAILDTADTPPTQRTPFSLTILSSDPATQIADLSTEVLDLNLSSDIQAGLLDKLASGLQALAKNGKNSAKTAANNIHSFINGVNAHRGQAITEDEAIALIADANVELFLLGLQP